MLDYEWIKRTGADSLLKTTETNVGSSWTDHRLSEKIISPDNPTEISIAFERDNKF